MSILNSSQIIKSMYENEEPEDIEGLPIDKYYELKKEELFNMFSSNKHLKIDLRTVNDFLSIFDTLYGKQFFSSFKPPLVQEYFCQQLNFLLIIDFILSFFRTNNKTFDVKKINTAFIFDFFTKLGDFYNFMNFLDVDCNFVEYLKYMIILYTLQLDRNVIESKFGYIIEILDNFFANDIMPEVFNEIKYKNLNELNIKINKFDKKFSTELKNYCKNTDYTNEDLQLNDLFELKYDWCSEPTIQIKTTKVEVMNPVPPPPINELVNEVVNNIINYHSDDEFDDDDDDDDDYYYTGTRRVPWTPTIMKDIPNIEETNPNYKNYREMYIFKNYQNLNTEKSLLLREIKDLCSDMGIKKYNFDNVAINNSIIKVKTILGLNLDLYSMDKTMPNTVFEIACEYGHLNIVINFIEFCKGKLPNDALEKIGSSPNREILQYVINNRKKFKDLDNQCKNITNTTFFEPKIRLNQS